MPAFRYRALAASGQVVQGQAVAANETALRLQLENEQGLVVFETGRLWRQPEGSVPPARCLTFMVHLAQSLRAGLPLVQSLADFGNEPGAMGRVSRGLLEKIQAGKTLSAAMAEFPGVFDSVTQALIRAGELGGQLEVSLATVSARLQQEIRVRASLRQILAYPCVVSLSVGGVGLFLLLYLIPQMQTLMENLGRPLAWHTQWLFQVSMTLRQRYWVLLLGLLVVGGGVALLWLNPRWRAWRDEGVLRLLVLGDLYRTQLLIRFLGCLEGLYVAGIPLLQGLELTLGLSDNHYFQSRIRWMLRAVSQGSLLSDAAEATGFFPSLVIRMLKLGESTGRLDSALSHARASLEQGLAERLAVLEKLLEPLLILLLGGLLMGVALAVFSPLYELVGGMQ